ncbi:ABC transporter permease [Anaeromyxobacter oryzisoli]|uniref:ABC transporter permease n=1 Tax=Anaeromyxobacter oryzisoli TaxID=2925408 RepID=UPI001F57622B|nr:ABC-2 family transporter protein [Anaeromyxobacter sp. SG63]
MLRYLRLLGVQFRASAAIAVQYRVEFLVRAGLALFWTGWTLVPLLVVYGARTAVAGWSFDEALVVVGWFTLLKGVLEGAVNPSLTAVVEHIRKGTLDFVLLKPADAQFLVSTAKFEPARVADLAGAAAVFAVAFHRMGRAPTPEGLLLAAVLLACAVAILYSLWILVISAAFVVVKVDNLSFLFVSIYDAARWPADVFRGGLRFVFTFVVPLAVMTTFPAEALLGRLGPARAALIAAGALAFSVLARVVWLRSIARYTSASS